MKYTNLFSLRAATVAIPLALLLCASVAHADRTVSIVVDATAGSPGMGTNGLRLANPSDVTVSFGLTCFSPTGFQMVSSSGITLAPKAMGTFPGGSVSPGMATCKDGTNATWAGNWSSNPSGGMMMGPSGTVYVCEKAGGVTYANRDSACGITMHACSISEITNLMMPGGAMGVTGVKNYWIGSPTTGGYSISTDSGATYGAAGGSTVPQLNVDYTNPMTFNANFCTVGGSGPPAPPAFGGCLAAANTGTASGTVCCNYTTDFSQGGMCKINIDNSTPASGYLQSPSFKGGSPF